MKRLECKALHYQWGRKGAESTVAQLRKDTIEEDEYYAEVCFRMNLDEMSEFNFL